jgi:hypothetical protein
LIFPNEFVFHAPGKELRLEMERRAAEAVLPVLQE